MRISAIKRSRRIGGLFKKKRRTQRAANNASQVVFCAQIHCKVCKAEHHNKPLPHCAHHHRCLRNRKTSGPNSAARQVAIPTPPWLEFPRLLQHQSQEIPSPFVTTVWPLLHMQSLLQQQQLLLQQQLLQQSPSTTLRMVQQATTSSVVLIPGRNASVEAGCFCCSRYRDYIQAAMKTGRKPRGRVPHSKECTKYVRETRKRRRT